MTVNLNPDPHVEGFKPQPTFNVTTIFHTLDDVLRAIRSLEEHGFTDEAVSVYLGKDGLSLKATICAICPKFPGVSMYPLISSELASRNAATGHCAPWYSECPILNLRHSIVFFSMTQR